MHLAPGPHLVTVVHEELAEAGPVHHVRVEVRRLKTEIGIRRQRGMHVDENWWYYEFFAPARAFSFLPSANMSCCL